MFWLDPVMNLISMLFHAWLAVVSHWIVRGVPSLVLLGVSGDGAEEDEASVVCRSTRLGMATTEETLVKAARAQGARETARNFILIVVLGFVQEVECNNTLSRTRSKSLGARSKE